MKRFWTKATVAADSGGHAVLLDGRGVRTRGGERLRLPGRALAEAVADEWRAVEAEVRPHAMPLTGIANAALDIVAPDPAGFAAGLAAYGDSDMLCYRAEHPAPLVARQAALWDPLVTWAEARFDIVVKVTAGLMPIGQPPLVGQRIGAAYAAQSPFHLAALSPLVSLSGSAIIPLALAEAVLCADAAWEAALVDEQFQADTWGEDPLAAASRADRRRQFEAAARFLRLAGSRD